MFEQARSFDGPAEAGAWLGETFGAWADKLPQDQHDAIEAYKGDTYDELNRALRGRYTLLAGLRATAAALDQALKRFSLPEPVIVYRGLRMIVPLTAGLVIRDYGYCSTSLLQRTAAGFLALSDPGEHLAIARILLPAGQPCGAPDLVEYVGEHEILLPRGSRFQILDAAQPSEEAPYWRVDWKAL